MLRLGKMLSPTESREFRAIGACSDEESTRRSLSTVNPFCKIDYRILIFDFPACRQNEGISKTQIENAKPSKGLGPEVRTSSPKSF
jgi:hypothetical protein